MEINKFIGLMTKLEQEAIKKSSSSDERLSLPAYISNLHKLTQITDDDFKNFKYIWQLRNEYLSNNHNIGPIPGQASEIVTHLIEKIR